MLVHLHFGSTLAAIPLAVWAHVPVLCTAHCVCHGPIRTTCPDIEMYEIGPCEFLFMIAFRLLWANSGSSARSVHLAGILLAVWAYAAVSCTAHCVHDRPTHAPCLNIAMYEMGLCECLHTIGLKLMWANPSSLLRAVKLLVAFGILVWLSKYLCSNFIYPYMPADLYGRPTHKLCQVSFSWPMWAFMRT